jgi:hypothetical protein
MIIILFYNLLYMIDYKKKYLKYKLKYINLNNIINGGAEPSYKKARTGPTINEFLYLFSDELDETKQLTEFIKLKENLKLYLSTPYDSGKLIEIGKYEKDITALLLEKGLENKEDLEKAICYKSHPDQPHKLCQSHGGNIFEHSQWTALHIYTWFIEQIDLTTGLENYKDFLMVAAFFHDIGKGGDCYFNVYDELKYDKGGDSKHPFHSSEMIIGRKLYIINCTEPRTSINIKEIIINYFNFNDNQIKIIAFIAYMHWEFGKLNIPIATLEIKCAEYVTKFIEGFNLYFVEPKSESDYLKSLKEINEYIKLNEIIDIITLLRLCIIISCADIASGTNLRIKDTKIDNFKVSDLKYISKDPWVSFNMNEKYSNYLQNLIDYFKFNLKD